jgi:hypothetical protein
MKELYHRWETDTKYYKANLYRDLFNDWILEKSWGSKFSRRGGEQLVFCTSRNDGLSKIKALNSLRARRGYDIKDIEKIAYKN